MRTFFEPNDFYSCGQMIIRNSYPKNGKDIEFAASVAYKVAYQFTLNEGNRYFLVAITDGMLIPYSSIETLCNYLNNDKYGFRPMSQEEITVTMANIGNGFR